VVAEASERKLAFRSQAGRRVLSRCLWVWLSLTTRAGRALSGLHESGSIGCMRTTLYASASVRDLALLRTQIWRHEDAVVVSGACFGRHGWHSEYDHEHRRTTGQASVAECTKVTPDDLGDTGAGGQGNINLYGLVAHRGDHPVHDLFCCTGSSGKRGRSGPYAARRRLNVGSETDGISAQATLIRSDALERVTRIELAWPAWKTSWARLWLVMFLVRRDSDGP
jgi:hypothetical protein